MVQVFINSGGGAAGFDRMPIALADGVASLAGSAWPIFAPFIGGLGAFVAGSNTVSNMMFSLFQFGVGERIGVDPSWMVALQAVGGAAGNMICVHNVVASLRGRRALGKRRDRHPHDDPSVRVPTRSFLRSIGYIIVWYADKGLVNAGTVLVAAIIAFAGYFVSSQLRQSHS